ncbi:hypothetical protein OSTOST_11230 [Ostertagia ostertagi]
MQGPMGSLDNELRKELEQALVDEIAKNLGDTIDQMGTSNIEDEDLGKLIALAFQEEGFSEIEKESWPQVPQLPLLRPQPPLSPAHLREG